jgi:hypothetical protein
MRWFYIPTGGALALIAAYTVFTNQALNSRPLDDGLAHDALVRELRERVWAGDNIIDLGTATIIHRNGEAVLYGQGTAYVKNRSTDNLPISEKTRFDYIVIMGRNCNDWNSACYQAEEIGITAEQTVLPMI